MIFSPPEVLNNDSVLKMARSGFGETLIRNGVRVQPGNRCLTPEDVVKGKQVTYSSLSRGDRVGNDNVSVTRHLMTVRRYRLAGEDVALWKDEQLTVLLPAK